MYDDPSHEPEAALQLIRSQQVDGMIVQATREAVQHLVMLGHRRIGFIGGYPNMVVTLDRLEGYRQALAEAALP
jgi:DNA-binding LacI/PurR family transcriptional regulator